MPGTVLWMGTLADPQKLRVRTIALDFMIAWASLWETFGLSFSQHTHAWQWGIRKFLGLNGPTCLQLPTIHLGRKQTCLDSRWGCYECFHFTLEPMMSVLRWNWRVSPAAMKDQASFKKYHWVDPSKMTEVGHVMTWERAHIQMTDRRKYLDPPQE